MGTSTESDVAQVIVNGATAGAVQPDPMTREAPNCCESVVVAWLRMALCGNTESALGVQLVVGVGVGLADVLALPL
jgi:hypothetical protein